MTKEASPLSIQALIHQDEGPTLEFKREWYKLDAEGKTKAFQKGELTKDILSLANGNAYSAGEPGYLVIGVDEQRNENGSRALYDVGDSIPTSASILSIVRAVSNPPLEKLEIVPFQVDDKRLFAVVVFPSPHLHEITRPLETPSQTYSEYVVFMRRNDMVGVASAREREAIQKLKTIKFSESHNVPPVLFGTATGAIIGASFLSRVGEKLFGTKEGFAAGLIVGPVLGGLLGGMIGSAYRSIIAIRSDWPLVPPWGRAFSLLVGGVTTFVIWIATVRFGDRFGRRPSGRAKPS